MRLSVPCAALAAAWFTIAAPASAALQLFTFSGTAGVLPSSTPIAVLQQFQGATVVGAFLIDTAAAGQQFTGPVGGQGQSALLTGAVLGGQVDIFGTNGPVTIFSTSNSPGNIFTVDNGGTPNPSNRMDQMAHTAGAALISGTLIKPYDILGNVPVDLFVGSLFFGRTVQGPVASPPAMITDVATRDFAGVLTGPLGNPLFINIGFRQGDPIANGAISGLPLQSLGVGALQLAIIDLSVVPEPAAWALFIAGFGMVGSALRHRRVAPAT